MVGEIDRFGIAELLRETKPIFGFVYRHDLGRPEHSGDKCIAHAEGTHPLYDDCVSGSITLLRVGRLRRPPERAVSYGHLLRKHSDLVWHLLGHPEHERPRKDEHLLCITPEKMW